MKALVIVCSIAVAVFEFGCGNTFPEEVIEPTFTVPTNTTLPAGSNTVSGRVTDPSDGSGRSDVTVSVTVTNGGQSYQAQTTTDAAGNYEINTVPAGTGSVEVIYEGNISTLTIDTTTGNVSGADLTPPSAAYAADRFIITLTWGATPRDLDSHLWIPDGSPFHLYYARKGDNVGPLDSAPFAGLDVDDVNGLGPETVTIKINNNSAYYSGTYKYWVYNYSRRPSISTSNAKVTVYQDGVLMKTYTVPTTGTTELYWHVFELNGTTITDINTLSNSAPTRP